MSRVTKLECSRCGTDYPAGTLQNLCKCGGPLLVLYDLDAIRQDWTREQAGQGPCSMWRYAPVLPVADAKNIVSLGEGMTPLQHTARFGDSVGIPDLWVKDEGLNPTASFKARGLSCAISMCKELGVRKVAIPSAGNAASALAAYAALAGMEAHIFMPQDVPQANYIECKAYGAQVTLVNGLISDCGKIVAQRSGPEGWFDISTLKEPYRIEGKKTMGYELAAQLGWNLPDAVLYPAGGGVGLIGMWKAFGEMETLGWISSKRPKMIAVQAAGCAPVVRAFEQRKDSVDFWDDAYTVAAGLRVPKPLGDQLMLRAIRESDGCALAIPDDEMLTAAVDLATAEGIFAAPEGGACMAALKPLLQQGVVKREDRVVVYNTGSGLKYLEAFGTRFPRNAMTEQDKLGGLITPR